MSKFKNKKFSVVKTKYIDMLNFDDLTEDNINTLRYSNDGNYFIIIGKIKNKNWIDDIPDIQIVKEKDIKTFLQGDNWKAPLDPND